MAWTGFSEDIDLDGLNSNIQGYVQMFCDEYGYGYRVAKDTDTVRRFMVRYDTAGRPLKIGVSYRRKEISAGETDIVNGIRVYVIDTLCIMKANAYAGRDAIRVLYDLAYTFQTKALHRGLYRHLIPQFHQKQGEEARPGCTPDQEGQHLALWLQGPHWRG
jgi:hypothetical protein